MKFKVGDKVKVKSNNYNGSMSGLEARVSSISSLPEYLTIKWITLTTREDGNYEPERFKLFTNKTKTMCQHENTKQWIGNQVWCDDCREEISGELDRPAIIRREDEIEAGFRCKCGGYLSEDEEGTCAECLSK